MNNYLANALLSSDPSLELPADDRIYDRLIGSWNARVIDYGEDNTRTETTGEWHFSYALEGRAVQDVFIVPARSGRNPETQKLHNRYGTSIRSFDPDKREWTIRWINPVTGAFNTLAARPAGANIVQEGTDSDGSMIRWGFTDIKDDSARWYGERSRDGGNIWKLEAEFFLTRSNA